MPRSGTDTDATPTDNDSQALVEVADLPTTGSDLLTLIGSAVGLLTVGGGLLLARRRRTSNQRAPR